MPSSPLPKRKVLRELGILLRAPTTGGSDAKTNKDLRTDQEAYQPPWNRLTIQEERSVLFIQPDEMPELSCRQHGRASGSPTTRASQSSELSASTVSWAGRA